MTSEELEEKWRSEMGTELPARIRLFIEDVVDMAWHKGWNAGAMDKKNLEIEKNMTTPNFNTPNFNTPEFTNPHPA